MATDAPTGRTHAAASREDPRSQLLRCRAWLDTALGRCHAVKPGHAPLAPAIVPLPRAAIFADISGFNQLTRRYTDRGADGTETLPHIIDDFLVFEAGEPAPHTSAAMPVAISIDTS